MDERQAVREYEEARRMRERDEHLKSSTIARGERDQCATDDRTTGAFTRAVAGESPAVKLGAEGLTLENVEDVFTYHQWDGWQQEAGTIVRESLTAAARAILRVVPAGPSRTRALNNLMDARMLCNQSITFRGRF